MRVLRDISVPFRNPKNSDAEKRLAQMQAGAEAVDATVFRIPPRDSKRRIEAKTTGMEYIRERREFVPRGMGRKQRWAQS